MSLAAQSLRLFHTVRHLKRTQIVGRMVHRLHRPRVARAPAPPRRVGRGPWQATIERPRSISGTTATFLNITAPIDRADIWNAGALPKLWLYNLHYFDDLCGPPAQGGAATQAALMRRWIDENPLGVGNGWEPYPVSLRLVTWIKWLLRGHAPIDGMLDSLALQARWLERRLEWHLLGNHILANAKALVFAGLFFDGAEAQRWLTTGLDIYARELPEQILPDGGHFELSPMYHAIILEDLLDVLNLARHGGHAQSPIVATLPDRVAAMRDWLAAMTHPDGELSFFNDATFDIAPPLAAIEAYASRLELPARARTSDGVRHLTASGYVRVDAGPVAILMDVGAVGPDYIPGHAHADTLAFELSVAGQRLIVNGGISTYATGPRRLIERGTAAHNTVEVDGRNSSDVWGGFRVGQRARVTDVEVEATSDGTFVSAAHDGYRRQFGGPLHRRTWLVTAAHVVVRDRLEGGRYGAARARFHGAGGVTISPEKGAAVFTKAGQPLARLTTSVPSTVSPSHWAPGFSTIVDTACLDVTLIDRAQDSRIDVI